MYETTTFVLLKTWKYSQI